MRNKERNDCRRNKGAGLNNERNHRIIEKIICNELVELIINVCARIEEELDVINEEELVAEEILEHLLDGEAFVVFSDITLLKLEAGGNHRDDCKSRTDNRNNGIIEIDFFADKNGSENKRNSRTDTRPNALI